MENFNYPYTTTGIRAFWRHWHISLSSWFRDYLYIPLGGNRKGKLRSEINKCIVFFCTGLWHGASWTFVIWGLWHGLFIILEDLNIIPAKKIQKNVIGHVYTLLVVVCGFVLFRADSLSQAFAMLGSMFSGIKTTVAASELFYRVLNGRNISIFILAIITSIGILPAARAYLQKKNTTLLNRLDIAGYGAALLLLTLNVISIASSTFNPFIYFRF